MIEIPDLDRDTDVERMIESRDRLNADQETEPQPVADGGQPDSDDGGCPHGHELCEGRDSPRENPELCFPCWKAEAQYEPELIEADD